MIAVAVASVACSDSQARESVDPEFTRQLDRDIESAQEAGATAEQVAILQEAQETGEITFEAYSEAVDRALRCARQAGVAVQGDSTIEHRGLRLRSYSVPVEADPREPLPGYPVHRCVADHSFWVERMYQLQPVSLEAQEAHYERYRSAIVDCLAEYGVEVEPDLSYEELSSQFRDPDDENTQTFGRCLDESGYSRS